MVAVAADHLPQLGDAILHDVGSGFGAHAIKRIGTPGWNFFLNENAVPVAVIECTPVLLPMNSGKDTVQFFQLIVIVTNPGLRFGHTKLGVAAGHTLHPHQPHPLAVEVKATVLNFKLADPECGREAVERLSTLHDRHYKTIEMGMIKMPEARIG
jgi:hypothetical protein